MRFLVTSLALFALATTACSASPDADEDSAAQSSPCEAGGKDCAAETIVLSAKLYDEPDAKLDAFCDRYVRVTVTRGKEGKLTAKLENELSPTSTCEVWVEPNTRSGAIVTKQDCGSTVYEGKLGTANVLIWDHRTRVCEDLQRDMVRVEETEGAKTATYYGEPDAVTQPEPAKPEKVLLAAKLYDAPDTVPSKLCDVHTRVVIAQTLDGKMTATLESQLGETSTCKNAVIPNTRSYPVTKASDGCGSTVYSGKNAADTLLVTDHRTRLCEDLPRAAIPTDASTERARCSPWGAHASSDASYRRAGGRKESPARESARGNQRRARKISGMFDLDRGAKGDAGRRAHSRARAPCHCDVAPPPLDPRSRSVWP